jgi:ABC-type dipeptide/oligopeptide/nickel transport system permease component
MTPEERAEFVADIAAAIRLRLTDKPLTEQESEWVRLAIRKEAQAIEFRKAIIEKSLSALIVTAMLAIAAAAMGWFVTHFYKP